MRSALLYGHSPTVTLFFFFFLATIVGARKSFPPSLCCSSSSSLGYTHFGGEIFRIAGHDRPLTVPGNEILVSAKGIVNIEKLKKSWGLPFNSGMHRARAGCFADAGL